VSPAVQSAIAAIGRQLALVRVQQPGLTPAQQLREARARCREAILAANDAVDRATALTSLRPMTPAELAEKRGRGRLRYANSATAESRTNRTNGAASAMAIAQTNTTAMAMSATTTACGNPALAGGGNVQRPL
jgi:hypothetical protein